MADLYIPHPCHENWSEMRKTEEGRFCRLCQKQVIDFTSHSDSGIQLYLDQFPEGTVCGRFLTTQLEPAHTGKPDSGQQVSRSSWLKQWIYKGMVLSGLMIFAQSKIIAQGAPSSRRAASPQCPPATYIPPAAGTKAIFLSQNRKFRMKLLARKTEAIRLKKRS